MKVERIDRNCIGIEKDGKIMLLNGYEAEGLAMAILNELQGEQEPTEAEILADIAQMEYKAERAI